MQPTTVPAPLPARPIHDQRLRPHRLMEFEVQVRIGILFAGTSTCLLAWFVHSSLASLLLQAAGRNGHVVLMMLTMCLCVGYIDVLINDVLPPRFRLVCVKRHRHHGYGVIVMFFLLQAYLAIGDSIGAEDILALGYLLNAASTAWFVWTTSNRGWHV